MTSEHQLLPRRVNGRLQEDQQIAASGGFWPISAIPRLRPLSTRRRAWILRKAVIEIDESGLFLRR
jgi:hypothetical protein